MIYNWLHKTFNWSYIGDVLVNAASIIVWYFIFVVIWGLLP